MDAEVRGFKILFWLPFLQKKRLIISKIWKRLGISTDWPHTYLERTYMYCGWGLTLEQYITSYSFRSILKGKRKYSFHNQCSRLLALWFLLNVRIWLEIIAQRPILWSCDHYIGLGHVCLPSGTLKSVYLSKEMGRQGYSYMNRIWGFLSFRERENPLLSGHFLPWRCRQMSMTKRRIHLQSSRKVLKTPAIDNLKMISACQV